MDKSSFLKKDICRNICVAVSLTLISLAVVMMSTVDPLSSSGRHWYDSSVFVYVAKVMDQGGLPYKDAFDHKGPLLYFINLAGWKIGYNGIWYVEFLFMLLSSLGIYKTARLFAGKASSVITVLIVLGGMSRFFEGGNFTEEYALPLQIFALYIFLDYLYNGKTSDLRIFIAGALMGLAVMLRANMIPVWAVFAGFIFFRMLYERRFKELGKFIALFLSGVAAAVLPFIIYIAANHIMDDFIKFYWVLNLKYTKAVDDQVSGSFLETFGKFLVLPAVIVSVLIMIYKSIKGDKKSRPCDICYIVYMLISIALISMGGRYYLHYAMVILPMLIYPYAWAIGSVTSFFASGAKGERKDKLLLILSSIVLAICAFFILIIPWFEIFKSLRNDIVYHNMGVYNTYSESYNDLIDYIDSNTSADDKISVYGNAVHIYLSSDRMSASRYEYNTRKDVFPEIMDEYLNELDENNVRMVISRGEIEDEAMLEFMHNRGFSLTQSFGEYKVYE
ncbi:MAG: glycosyltransferase family 39 protein [Saccharofermentans sp.]|nr:glycosyltransferase family 39 protein [Saccharofermentans sp.]